MTLRVELWKLPNFKPSFLRKGLEFDDFFTSVPLNPTSSLPQAEPFPGPNANPANYRLRPIGLVELPVFTYSFFVNF